MTVVVATRDGGKVVGVVVGQTFLEGSIRGRRDAEWDATTRWRLSTALDSTKAVATTVRWGSSDRRTAAGRTLERHALVATSSVLFGFDAQLAAFDPHVARLSSVGIDGRSKFDKGKAVQCTSWIGLADKVDVLNNAKASEGNVDVVVGAVFGKVADIDTLGVGVVASWTEAGVDL